MDAKKLNQLRIVVTRSTHADAPGGGDDSAGENEKVQFEIEPSEIDTYDFESGDELTVIPEKTAASLVKTPDGSVHVPAPGGGSFRVPPRMALTEFKGYKLPEHLVLLTGAGGETLEPIGKAHLALYNKFLGLLSEMSIVEIGCGMGRDAMQFEDRLGPDGQYVGIDVTRDAIAWCRLNIGKKNPNFAFHHFDAVNEVYNPLGAKTTLDFELPVESRSIDRVVLGSVFTHLLEDEVRHYLREIARVLKPDGLSYATFFLYSEKTITYARDTNLTPFDLRFEHAGDPGSYFNDPQYPRGAVAFTEDLMNDMIGDAGLRLNRPFLKGWWSGAHKVADEGQEAAVLALA